MENKSMYGMKKKMMGGGMAYGKKKKMRDGGKSFKDFNKDGKITQADILMGRGVKLKKKMMDGGSVNENINPYGRPADTSLI